MANNGTKGIVLKIDGDTSGLVTSISNANKKIDGTYMSLKKVNQALKLDPSNVDALQQKQALLVQAIEGTKDKLNAEKQAAEQAAQALEKGTITKDEYNQLQAEVALTASKLSNLEKEAGDTANKLDTMGNDAAAAAKDEKKVGTEADTAGKKTSSFGDKAKKAGDVAKKAFTAAAAAAAAITAAAGAAVKEVVNLANETAAAGDKVDKQSQKLHMSAETYQEWSHVMELSGASIDSMGAGMKKLTNLMDDAKSGSEGAVDKFSQLGISMEDINNLSTEEVFAKVVTGFQGMEDSAERAALANDVLGKSGSELAPLFNTTTEETQRMIDEAHKYGLVMSDELVSASADYTNSLSTMKGAIQGAKNDLIGQLLPGMTEVTEGITKLVNGEEGASEQIGQGVEDVLAAAQTLVPGVMSAIEENLPSLLVVAQTILQTVLEGLISLLPTLLPFAGQMLTTMATTIMQALPTLIPALVELINYFVTWLSTPENLTMLLDAVMAILDSLVNGIEELLPVLLPAVVDIINTISVYATEHLDEIIAMAVKIIAALVKGLIQALPKVIAGTGEIIAALLGALADLPGTLLGLGEDWIGDMMNGFNQPGTITSKIGEVITTFLSKIGELPGQLIKNAMSWGKDMLTGFVNGFKNNLSILKNGLSNFGSTIKSFIHFSQPDEGPLSGPNGFNTYGPDMVDTFAEGVESQLPTLKRAVTFMGSTIKDGMQPDYSGVLGDIRAGIAGIGTGSQQIVIPVNIGGTRLDTVIARSQNNTNYRSGGH